MKKYLVLIVVLVTFLLSGCSEKIVYINSPVPDPVEKPIFEKYEVNTILINNIVWYAMQKSEANKAASNWISYKNWCEANYEILKKLKINSNKESK